MYLHHNEVTYSQALGPSLMVHINAIYYCLVMVIRLALVTIIIKVKLLTLLNLLSGVLFMVFIISIFCPFLGSDSEVMH